MVAKKLACRDAIDNHVNQTTKVIGIGSGSTVVYCIDILKEKILRENLTITACIPTSFQARELIIKGQLPLGDLNQFPVIDVTFDGADEVDLELNLIKGGGGCHLQEKLVASCSKQLIIVADERKDSTILGQKWKKGIPIEVIPLGLNVVLQKLEQLNGKPVIRQSSGKAGPVITDNGNILLDCDFGEIQDVCGLSQSLNGIVGLVEHGLFYSFTDHVYFGKEDGSVKHSKKKHVGLSVKKARKGLEVVL